MPRPASATPSTHLGASQLPVEVLLSLQVTNEPFHHAKAALALHTRHIKHHKTHSQGSALATQPKPTWVPVSCQYRYSFAYKS
jgi:hypothetical protein